jgi:ribosome-associated heat shock protein Hsp15
MSRRELPASVAEDPPRRQRLDKWLWFARFARTRALAARHIAANAVRVDGRRITAAGYPLKLGDVLTLGLPHVTCVVRVRDLGIRRGSAPEARLLYETLGESNTTSAGVADRRDDRDADGDQGFGDGRARGPDDPVLADEDGTG